MLTLILLRHAKAEPQGPTDFERPLADRGSEQARVVARHLTEHGLIPDIVLCSPALRTRQTWQEIAARLEEGGGENGLSGAPTVHYPEELYSARPSTVRALVREYANTEEGAPGESVQTLLVVGHEPIMSMTAADYADSSSARAAMFSVQAGMSTASLALIDLPDFGARQGHLRAILRS